MRLFKTILLLIFVAQISISAQQNIKFSHILTGDGLIQGYILSMHEDSKGNVWIGTFSYLQKYNGNNFTNYFYDPNDSTSISANTVFCMAEDSNNNLWLGTERGLCKYLPETNSFKRYLHDPQNPNSLGFELIKSIVVTEDNILWLGTYGGGVERFDPKTEIFTHYKKIEGDNNSLKSNLVNALYIDNERKLWIGTEGGGLTSYNEQTNTFKNYFQEEPNSKSINCDIISSITQDKDGIFWIGTWYDGLFRFDEMKQQFKQYSNKPDDPNSIPSNTIRQILIDPNDNMWLATHWGLLLFDRNTGKYRNYLNNSDNNKTIVSNTISSLLYNKEGILWVGSFGAGISLYDKNSNKFDVYSAGNKENSLSSNRVNDIFEDVDSKIWIATDNGISILDRTNSTYSYLFKEEELLIKTCRTIYKDSYNYYWIGNDLGLIRVSPDLSTHQLLNVGNGIYTITQDYLGDIWAGGWNTGLIKIPKKQLQQQWINEESIIHYLHNPIDSSTIKDNIVWKIFEDNQHNLWVGTKLSAEIFDRGENKFLLQLKDLAAIVDIMQDNEDNYWFATTGFGIVKYNPNTGQIKKYSESEGLASKIGLSIMQDNDHFLWVSTENGLSRFDSKLETFKNYSESDGLPSNYLSLGAYHKLSTGELAYGSNKGFVLVNPSNLEENTIKPVLELTDFSIFQKSVTKEYAEEASDIRFEKPVNHIKEITLPYYDNMLTFEFTAISFSLTEKNTYEYYLEGFDKHWNKVGNEHKATYTNLDPGEYFFRVKAYNSDGYESENELKIKLTIKPPFWQTWWMRILIFTSFILLLYTFYRLRLKYLNAREVELKRMVDERTLELGKITDEVIQQKEELMVQASQLSEINESLKKSKEDLSKHKDNLEEIVKERTEELIIAKEKAEESDMLKSAFLANMSHEIRTPMNAIMGFSSLLNDSNVTEDERSVFINQINSNSEALLLLIDDILDFSQLEAKQPIISFENFKINDLVDEIFTYWSLKDEKSNVEFRMSNTIKDLSLSVHSDKFRIKQIINNFLSNAWKFTENGLIELGLELRESNVCIYVKDTGIGISKENLNVVFERFRKIEHDNHKIFRGVGLGMAISKHLADLLKAEIWVESEINIGSTFYLSLPYNQEKATDLS